ncbi:MAG: hypothetical protein ACOY4W_03725 [Thermodesulfobacteriota bacterium]
MRRWIVFLDKALGHKGAMSLQQWLGQLLSPGPAPDRLLVLDGHKATATAILDVMSHLVTLEQTMDYLPFSRTGIMALRGKRLVLIDPRQNFARLVRLVKQILARDFFFVRSHRFVLACGLACWSGGPCGLRPGGEINEPSGRTLRLLVRRLPAEEIFDFKKTTMAEWEDIVGYCLLGEEWRTKGSPEFLDSSSCSYGE